MAVAWLRELMHLMSPYCERLCGPGVKNVILEGKYAMLCSAEEYVVVYLDRRTWKRRKRPWRLVKRYEQRQMAP